MEQAATGPCLNDDKQSAREVEATFSLVMQGCQRCPPINERFYIQRWIRISVLVSLKRCPRVDRKHEALDVRLLRSLGSHGIAERKAENKRLLRPVAGWVQVPSCKFIAQRHASQHTLQVC